MDETGCLIGNITMWDGLTPVHVLVFVCFYRVEYCSCQKPDEKDINNLMRLVHAKRVHTVLDSTFKNINSDNKAKQIFKIKRAFVHFALKNFGYCNYFKVLSRNEA